MTAAPNDTPLHIERILIKGYRAMSSAQKLGRVVAMNRALDELATARIKMQQGDEVSERETRLRLASLHLDPVIMRTVFGWDPELRGF